MRKVKFVLLFVVLSLLLFGIGSAPEASAQEPDRATVLNLIQELDKAGDDAEKVFSQLSPEEQKAVIEALRVARVSTKTTVSATTKSGCKTSEVWHEYYSFMGVHLWTYKQRIDWCFDGTNVTFINRDRWGEVHAPLWEFVGHTGNHETGGVNQSYYRARTQGEFKICVGGDIGCIQHQYPWLEQKVEGDGDHWEDGGG